MYIDVITIYRAAYMFSQELHCVCSVNVYQDHQSLVLWQLPG